MEGRDVMGLAQTGTGKTAAFVLPILQRLMQGPRGRIRALIIAPTRELSEQTHKAIGQLGRRAQIHSASIYGGVGIGGQIARLRDKVDIVSACPGRLLDHIQRNTIDLSHIEVLVLDEADHMFDMGFLPDVRKIVKHLPKQRQTLLFSATMPNDIKSLANDLLQNPVNIEIGHAAPVETVSHKFYPVQMSSKTELLKNILIIPKLIPFSSLPGQSRARKVLPSSWTNRDIKLLHCMEIYRSRNVSNLLTASAMVVMKLWWRPISPPAALM